VTFDPLQPCPGASGEGCPHGSVIDPSRQLCHTCRKDTRRMAAEGVGTDPIGAPQTETVESSGNVPVRIGGGG
jgi:hypothetical protein